ncbi:hypothetical protein [Microbacterium sp. NPDC087591]|uniref:hypothetical protein n=1 Tax=Microbacterium sp. NPDC087591 TaxID=3364192 RepID=UPI00380673C8
MNMNRSAGHRRVLTLGVVGMLLGGALSGCSVGSDTGEPVDYGDVATAIAAAVPRVVEVDKLDQSMNGLGHRLSVGLEMDTAVPFTPDELDAVVQSIWGTLPWEPNTIVITAGAADEETAVDVRSAADELEPLGATNAGQAGVSLTGMDARYGAWSAPE